MTWKLQRHMSQKAIATESRGTSGLKLQHCQTSGSPTPPGIPQHHQLMREQGDAIQS